MLQGKEQILESNFLLNNTIGQIAKGSQAVVFFMKMIKRLKEGPCPNGHFS